MYNSEDSGPPEALEEDQFQFEVAVLAVADDLSVPVLEAEKIVYWKCRVEEDESRYI